MDVEHAPYTPERINAMLREWERWTSLAEGHGALPDAHRHASGGVPDPMHAADQVADVERAIAACLRAYSLEWQTVRAMQIVGTIDAVAVKLSIRRQNVGQAYRVSVNVMARFLGWTESS